MEINYKVNTVIHVEISIWWLNAREIQIFQYAGKGDSRMGIPAELFTQAPIDPQFLCAFCEHVLEDPVTLQPCGHTLCTCCAKLAAVFDGAEYKCPIHRQDASGFQVPSANFINALNSLELRCYYHEEGCTAMTTVASRYDHKCKFNKWERCADCGDFFRPRLRDSHDSHSCVKYLKERLADADDIIEFLERRIEQLHDMVLAGGGARRVAPQG